MPKYEERLDAVFKSLGDAGRRAMLIRLSHGEATLGQLAEPLAMSLPAVHQHLGVLEAAGLVTCEKRGRERWCRLEASTLRLAEGWIADHRQLWERRADALDRYLEDSIPKRRQRR
jgi:DNA-binding transcriptional ArsR family regulator